eukprot:8842125-Pyramimonas_sp.AAC.1
MAMPLLELTTGGVQRVAARERPTKDSGQPLAPTAAARALPELALRHSGGQRSVVGRHSWRPRPLAEESRRRPGPGRADRARPQRGPLLGRPRRP